MSDSETLKTSKDGRYRVRLVLDEHPDEPYNDGQSPLLQLDTGHYGNHAKHVMATGRPLDDDARIEEAAARWGSDFTLLEKYLRAYYGAREFDTWHSGSYWYVTYDTARWRGYIGFAPGDVPAHPLVSLEEYRAYVEGDCWFYVVEQDVTWRREDDPDTTMRTWETVDSSGGFYGWDYAEESALEAFRYAAGLAGDSAADLEVPGSYAGDTIGHG